VAREKESYVVKESIRRGESSVKVAKIEVVRKRSMCNTKGEMKELCIMKI
jgi:hypothetical protein